VTVAYVSLYDGVAMLQNDMEFLRVRSAKHEVMVAPSELLLGHVATAAELRSTTALILPGIMQQCSAQRILLWCTTW
jgi:hypothetical protein